MVGWWARTRSPHPSLFFFCLLSFAARLEEPEFGWLKDGKKRYCVGSDFVLREYLCTTFLRFVCLRLGSYSRKDVAALGRLLLFFNLMLCGVSVWVIQAILSLPLLS